MKILCVIDSFGSGGAQRQLVNLACGLKEKGHAVEAFVYYPNHDFFRPTLERAGVPIHSVQKKGRIGLNVLSGLVRLLRSNKYDAIISFLDTPNVYVAIASLFATGSRIIVSERSSYHHDKNRYLALGKRLLYGLADKVVANSRTQAEWLKKYPWLTGKVTAIYNGFPYQSEEAETPDMPPLRFLVIGRIGPEKNGIRLVEALELFRKRRGFVPEVSWAGKEDILPSGQKYVSNLRKRLEECQAVSARWNWLGERQDVMDLLSMHRALIHPSLYEGLPNVVCEAFMASRPVLASHVCDHPYLVGEDERGFLFDPLEPEAICIALEKMADLTVEEWRVLSANARSYAVRHLQVERMVSEYEALLA